METDNESTRTDEDDTTAPLIHRHMSHISSGFSLERQKYAEEFVFL